MSNEGGVSQYLEALGLQRFAAQFVDQGFDQLYDIFCLDDEDLDMLIPDAEMKQKYQTALREVSVLYEHTGNLNKASGVTSLTACSRLSLQSLDSMKINLPGHRKRLIRAAAIYQRDPRDPRDSSSENSVTVKFMIDSGSDTVTLHDDVIKELQLSMIGCVTQQVPGGTSRKIPLYSASLLIGRKKLNIEVVPDKVNTLGTPVLWEFRHLIDDKKHVWLAKAVE